MLARLSSRSARQYLYTTCEHCQLASSAAGPSDAPNPYPYPTQARPTSFQIFHLPRHASPSDVKQRYYELVRIYHPDTAIARFGVPPDVAHERFQAITTAYEALRGQGSGAAGGSASRDSQYATAAAWRAATQARRRDIHSEGDDSWKDKLILGGVVLSIAGFVAQMVFVRQKALKEARQPSNARIHQLSNQAAEKSLAAHDDGESISRSS
ncbi:hypothetical protein HGRIS_002201 [Hohenbuehelia grisea]|uniref:J domain-containing protein n=1 Tax=Hohenbuehelia grisea TaxID=104357 RepID=A0ABR3JJT7_9AGAR